MKQKNRDTWYSRLQDDPWYDWAEIVLVPRYKTSELSGNEWRYAFVVRLWRKRVLLRERRFLSMASAAGWIASTHDGPGADETDDERRTRSMTDWRALCAQPGCAEAATVLYEIVKHGCSRCGNVREKKRRHTQDQVETRGFCARHARRGDSDLDDSDGCYRLLSGTPAPESEDESPVTMTFVSIDPRGKEPGPNTKKRKKG